MGSFATPDEADNSAAEITFTEWSVLEANTQIDANVNVPCLLTLQNCQIYSGGISALGPTLQSANCLYQRVSSSLRDTALSFGVSNTFCNNLFLKGSLTVKHTTTATGSWTFRDNLFDQTSITNQSGSTNNVCSNNAYVTNFTILLPTNNSVILTASPAYQAGAFGVNYYPTNLTNLIHTGSQSAPAAGLYHYTVTTNNVIEGTNIVSIGFHYVAVGTNGLPLDNNRDGIPDYLEDANGNGLVDSGEIDWQMPGDLGLTVVITRPLNNSKVP